MFLQFFTSLREAQVPVTLREYLTLMEALDADLAEQSVDNFYYLSRAALVKDERNLDKFDRVFGSVFKGLESLLDAMGKAAFKQARDINPASPFSELAKGALKQLGDASDVKGSPPIK